MTDREIKAIGLLSGGLDSTLAAKVILDLGIHVEGYTCFTGFCVAEHRQRVPRGDRKRPVRNEALRAAADLGIEIELADISEEYLRMLTRPKFGYGSAINPCIDCRILMLRRAREHMVEVGAHFVFTGEVLGQRPMSQRRDTLRIIERESGLVGLLLRPLSAKHLPPTLPEQRGWVDRERLFAIQGRSRKEQMKLIRARGITDYPQPAGGCCFLTDQNYAQKLRDLLAHMKEDEELTMEQVMLLKVGRHFRLLDGTKVIIGRDEGENAFLENYRSGRWAFFPTSCKGPLVLAEGSLSPESRRIIAGLTARYSSYGEAENVTVGYEQEEDRDEITIEPSTEKKIRFFRI